MGNFSDLTTSFNDDGKIEYISQTSSNGTEYMYFYYGPERERWETVAMTSANTGNSSLISSKRHFYFGNYERITENNTVTEQYFLDNGVILIKKDGVLSFYQAFFDTQGSILSVFAEDGEKVFEASYDAWGRQTVVLNDIDLERGYCGHVMLPFDNLIDMGGRVYDSAVGRFLSCDNYVQEPNNSQNFNRYSYCLNNPLRYTDPTGEFWWIVAGAALGGVINWATHGGEFNSTGLAYFCVGALAGGVGSCLGGGMSAVLAGGKFWAGALGAADVVLSTGAWAGMYIGASSGFVGGFITGAGNAWIEGANFCSGLMQGLAGGGLGALTGGVVGGLTGGIDAVRNGADFWSGKSNNILHIEPVEGVPLSNDVEINAPEKITLKGLYRDSSNPHLHIEQNRLPGDNVWSSMTSIEKGEFGQRMYFNDVSSSNKSLNFVKEVSYKINGTTYRADWSYIDKNGVLHIVEVKTGVVPGLTVNQRVTIPAMMNGGNVKIVPYGGNAYKLFNGRIPSNVENWSFDMYWFQK